MLKMLPKLIVFDLDFTLWPFWVDTHYDPPFRRNKHGVIVDHRCQEVPFYPEVPMVLEKLQSLRIDLAVASRTSELEGANQLLNLFGWRKYFKYFEIYPGSKTKHFKEFKKCTGYDYSEMLFFDDEERNIKELSAVGVNCILVEDGVNLKLVDDALKAFK